MNIPDPVLEKAIDQAFSMYDTDNSGTIDKEEVGNVFNHVLQLVGVDLHIPSFIAKMALKKFDQDDDGKASKE